MTEYSWQIEILFPQYNTYDQTLLTNKNQFFCSEKGVYDDLQCWRPDI